MLEVAAAGFRGVCADGPAARPAADTERASCAVCKLYIFGGATGSSLGLVLRTERGPGPIAANLNVAEGILPHRHTGGGGDVPAAAARGTALLLCWCCTVHTVRKARSCFFGTRRILIR